MLAIGLICGTSLDGIDAALVEISPRGAGYVLDLKAAHTVPLATELAIRMRSAVAPGMPAPAEVAALDRDVGHAFGDAARAIAGGTAVDFVASHGVTLFHDGDRHLTAQIGDPFAIRECVDATVLFDFRRADCAAGGHGAPLAPYFDALMFGGSTQFTAALNLGGIANVTLLPVGAGAFDAVAWDIGPANMLLDAFVRRKTHARESFDRDGAFAAKGSVDERALEQLLRDPYFALAPPKTTGRERFGDAFVVGHAALLDALTLEDGCATLSALTAQTVADAVGAAAEHGRLIVSGGGVHNAALMRELRSRLGGYDVAPSSDAGVDPDFKEALAFTVLGYELLRGRRAGLPRVTGARSAALLGAIAPLNLAALLACLREELERTAGQES